MWYRINTKTKNNLIKQTMREQVTQVMPWFKEVTKIVTELEVDLNKATDINKTKWKKNVDEI